MLMRSPFSKEKGMRKRRMGVVRDAGDDLVFI